MSQTSTRQLLCVLCARLHNPADFCPVHPDEPLLDPTDDDVRFELMALDDKAKGRTYMRFGGVGAGLGFVLGIAVYYGIKAVAAPLAEAFRMEIVFGGLVGLLALGLLLAKLRYRPKFTEWTRDDHST
jgi:hypothetical protein